MTGGRMTEPIVIDGSIGEGGGQVLRTALALAALQQRPLTIHNIRANRKRPGLRPQHLAAVRALARITGAEVAGAHENSTALTFTPQTITPGHYRFRIGTAGSVTLLAAALLPPLLFAASPSTVVLEGGTHVPFSPVFQYLHEILLPFLRRMGAEVQANLEIWGWYPNGGGRCTLHITPSPGMKALRIVHRGRLRNLTMILGLAGLPLHIIDREEDHIRACLKERGSLLTRRLEAAPSPGQGNILFLKGEYDCSLAGVSALGKKGKPAEQVAQELCERWLAFESSEGAVDKHLADQILPYMALASGESTVIVEDVTDHLTTNIQIIERFLPVHFTLDPATRTIQVRGIAYAAL